MGLVFRWIASASLMLITGLVLFGGSAASAQECRNRGQLDTLYCDDNNDLVADTPTDPRRWKDPATLVFAYTPVEDPGRLSERVPAIHRISRPVHRQARDLLPGAIQHGRDRGDALRPPACRRLLDRPDRLRGQSGRRRPVRRQGHREGTAGLSPDRHRQGFEPLSETLRPQGQARRAHLAVVEFRQSRSARAVRRRRVSSPTRTTGR